jgi:hypothetical protein
LIKYLIIFLKNNLLYYSFFFGIKKYKLKMKTLNFLFVMVICLMAVSHVNATYYIIKTFENYGTGNAKEGELDEKGTKRVECFAGLVGSKINKPDAIFYKADGKDKNGNVKTINSRRNTAVAISEKLGVKAEEIEGGTTQLPTLKSSILDASNIQNALFVWSDKDKATELATALGATNAPAEFNKENYGTIWVIEGTDLKEVTMDCDGLSNSESGASKLYYSVMTIAIAVGAYLCLLYMY